MLQHTGNVDHDGTPLIVTRSQGHVKQSSPQSVEQELSFIKVNHILNAAVEQLLAEESRSHEHVNFEFVSSKAQRFGMHHLTALTTSAALIGPPPSSSSCISWVPIWVASRTRSSDDVQGTHAAKPHLREGELHLCRHTFHERHFMITFRLTQRLHYWQQLHLAAQALGPTCPVHHRSQA